MDSSQAGLVLTYLLAIQASFSFHSMTRSLVTIDNEITELMKVMTSDKLDMLIVLLEAFDNRLEELVNYIDEDDDPDKSRCIMLEYLECLERDWSRRVPRCIGLDWDGLSLMRRFNWTEDNMDDLMTQHKSCPQRDEDWLGMMLRATALTALLALVVHISLARRRLNILEENQTAKTTLHILDDNIVDYLSKPSPNTCRLLFPEIVSYNQHFKEIIDGFKERKFRFVRIAHVIYDKGGPNFMKLRIDAPMMLKVNGWTMNDMGELYYHLKATHRLWLEFKDIYEEVKTAVKGNWTQLKSTFHSTETPGDRLNISALIQSIIETTELVETDVTNVTPNSTLN